MRWAIMSVFRDGDGKQTLTSLRDNISGKLSQVMSFFDEAGQVHALTAERRIAHPAVSLITGHGLT